MYCCPNCFSDNFLQDHIQAISHKAGQCHYCNANEVDLIGPEELFDRFQPLLNFYIENKTGFPLNELIQHDWSVFNINSKRIQNDLLKAISLDKEISKNKYLPVIPKEESNIEEWERFKTELKHNNRFFPNNAPSKDQLEQFGKYIGKFIKKDAQKFYRARINNSDKSYDVSEIGKPPAKLVLNGRANPIGIPYLYLASTIDTAISEVRGHKGEKVTVGEFEMTSHLELADLRNPKSTISPFELNEENELELIYKNMPYLTLLGNELSKPIIPREANLEYLSSQYLCELIKQIGFHGIIFQSSISKGNNYVIFNDDKLEPTKTYQYQITDVVTKSKKMD